MDMVTFLGLYYRDDFASYVGPYCYMNHAKFEIDETIVSCRNKRTDRP